MSKATTFGQDASAPYLAFGDDSQFEGLLTYAFLIVPRHELLRIKRRLFIVKEKFKIPADTPIHCRVLMHKHAREKAGLGHLTEHSAKAVIGHIIREINRSQCGLRYAWTEFPEKPVVVPPQEGMHQIPFEPKYVLGMLAQGCFGVALDGSQGPLANQCEIVVAEDRTLISTGNKSRSQAHKATSGWSDIGAMPGQLHRIEPRVSTAVQEPLLEIADVLAYMCSHAFRAGPSRDFYSEQLSRLVKWTGSHVVLDFEPGPWINAPAIE